MKSQLNYHIHKYKIEYTWTSWEILMCLGGVLDTSCWYQGLSSACCTHLWPSSSHARRVLGNFAESRVSSKTSKSTPRTFMSSYQRTTSSPRTSMSNAKTFVCGYNSFSPSCKTFKFSSKTLCPDKFQNIRAQFYVFEKNNVQCQDVRL